LIGMATSFLKSISKPQPCKAVICMDNKKEKKWQEKVD
jgi:hypothetical protein